MVLHHVAHRPGLVVVGAPVLYAEGFVDADLHVIDVPGAPHRLEQGIGEAQRHQVLHRLLAEVVIDAEHPRFVEHMADRLVDRLRRFQRVAERLFQHDAGFRAGQAGDGEVLRDGREQRRRGRQVVHQHASFTALQRPAQAAEVGALAGIHGEIAEAGGETAPAFRGEIAARHLRPAMAFGQGEERTVLQVAPGQGEDPRIGRQAFLAMQVIERRQQFVQSQVAGAAEHQDVAGTR
ncbi:hypothetical protein D3C78_756800 [compost metagenome]